jgi:hypothetical protein
MYICINNEYDIFLSFCLWKFLISRMWGGGGGGLIGLL